MPLASVQEATSYNPVATGVPGSRPVNSAAFGEIVPAISKEEKIRSGSSENKSSIPRI